MSKKFIKLPQYPSYEDDCQIFYPTDWDPEYLAYKAYCDHCVTGIPTLPSPNLVYFYDDEVGQYQEVFIYKVPSYWCLNGTNLPRVPEHHEYTPFTSYNHIETCDYDIKDMESAADLNSEDEVAYVDNETDSNPSKNDYYQSEKYGRRCRRCRRQPSTLKLDSFIVSKSLTIKQKNITKQRKRNEIQSKKVQNANSRNYNNDCVIDPNDNQERTMENELIAENSNSVKLTYSATVRCHTTASTLTKKEVDHIETPLDETPTGDFKFYKSFSRVVSSKSPKSCKIMSYFNGTRMDNSSDTSSTTHIAEKIVLHKEVEQSFVSYADAIKTRKTVTKCARFTTNRSYVESIMNLREDFVVPDITETNTSSVEESKWQEERKIHSKSKEQWILKKSKKRRSKQNNHLIESPGSSKF